MEHILIEFSKTSQSARSLSKTRSGCGRRNGKFGSRLRRKKSSAAFLSEWWGRRTFYLNNLSSCYTLDGTPFYLFIVFLIATLKFLDMCVATWPALTQLTLVAHDTLSSPHAFAFRFHVSSFSFSSPPFNFLFFFLHPTAETHEMIIWPRVPQQIRS